MSTLAQLKRDANTGHLYLKLLWRFGATGKDIKKAQPKIHCSTLPYTTAKVIKR